MVAGKVYPDPDNWMAMRRKMVRELDASTAREHVAGNSRWLRQHYPVTFKALEPQLRELYKSIT